MFCGDHIVLLFADASDYSNKTCIYRSMCLYLIKYASLVGVITCVSEERLTFSQSLQYIFLTSKMAATMHTYVYGRVVTSGSQLCSQCHSAVFVVVVVAMNYGCNVSVVGGREPALLSF